MTQQFQPFGQPPPSWTDPNAATVPPRASAQPQTRFAIIAVAAFIAAAAALAAVGLGYVRSAKPSDVTQLRSELVTLQHQRLQDLRTIGGLSAKIGTLTTQQAAVSKQVGGMAPTVADLKPFTSNVCSQAEQGSKGAYTAAFPCRAS